MVALWCLNFGGHTLVVALDAEACLLVWHLLREPACSRPAWEALAPRCCFGSSGLAWGQGVCAFGVPSVIGLGLGLLPFGC